MGVGKRERGKTEGRRGAQEGFCIRNSRQRRVRLVYIYGISPALCSQSDGARAGVELKQRTVGGMTSRVLKRLAQPRAAQTSIPNGAISIFWSSLGAIEP